MLIHLLEGEGTPEATMRLWTAIWLVCGLTALAAIAVLLRWIRQRPTVRDLGAVSERWVSHHRGAPDGD